LHGDAYALTLTSPSEMLPGAVWLPFVQADYHAPKRATLS
jgi:hypothetical protein